MQKNNSRLLLIFLGSVLSFQADSVNAVSQGRSLQDENNTLSLNYHISDETRVLLKELDCPSCSFKTFGKYPSLISYTPSKNEVKTVLCGTYDKNIEDIKPMTQPWQLKAMVPVQVLTMMGDSNLKMDEKYRRETKLGKILEDMLKTIKILPSREYKGVVLFDEFMNGIPMKWVLRDIRDFRALKDYLLINIEKAGIAPSSKPLLVLEIVKKNTLLNDDDVAFLNTYFELADPTDVEVKEFFVNNQSQVTDAMRNFGGAKKVGDKFGDLLISYLEKPTEGFKPEVMALMPLSLIGGMIMAKMIQEPIKNQAKGIVGGLEKSCTIDPQVKWYVAGIAATLLSAYCISSFFETAPTDEEDLDDADIQVSKKDQKKKIEDAAEEVTA